MENEYQKGSLYRKRPLWQWLVAYAVIGGIVYGVIYYVVSARKGGYHYGPPEESGVEQQHIPSPYQYGE